MMVALNAQLPHDPDDRATIRRVLLETPGLQSFLERLNVHVEETFGRADMALESRQYDEWDPPVQIVITAPVPREQLGERLYALLGWANKDPDYDRSKAMILLHRTRTESEADVSRT